jgi:hypothetical protein
MHQNESVTQLAKAEAISGFATLTKNMMKEADLTLAAKIAAPRGQSEKRVQGAARHFLNQDGLHFEFRIAKVFANHLERAMQTMYRDLRKDVRELRAEDMTLIDDEAVNRLIDVDRVVTRMRDADQVDLGRISLSIARVHGFEEVRERENPFRPYLLARTLHDALRELKIEDDVSQVLFATLATAMAAQLPAFYRGIRNVFEHEGVSTDLKVQRSPEQRARYEAEARHAAELAGLGGSVIGARSIANEQLMSRMLPALERMMLFHTGAPAAAGPAAVPLAADIARQNQAAALQDFVFRVFNMPAAIMAGRHQMPQSTHAFDARLKQVQQAVAQPAPAAEGAVPAAVPSTFEQIDSSETSDQDKMMTGMVALLFDFIMRDELIPLRMRAELNRLQIPFLRASMLEPGIWNEPAHPTRELINRIAAVAIGMREDLPMDKSIEARIDHLIGQILARFDGDVGVFQYGLTQFDAFLVRQLRHHDTLTSQCGEAIDEAERVAAMTHNSAVALQDLLGPLAIDERIVDFITGPWLEVMAHPLSWDRAQGGQSQAAFKHNELLPELVWSGQEKQSEQERSELKALLPGLVARIRKGMELVGLDAERTKQAMDMLIAVHADVLRGGQGGVPAFGKRPMTLEQLYGRFHSIGLEPGSCVGTDGRPLIVRPLVLRAALARRDVAATLVLSYEQFPATPNDPDWLRQMRVGTSVILKVAGADVPARLSGMSPNGCLYMFSTLASAEPHIYSCTSMLRALQDQQIRPSESALIFDRAVVSLVADVNELSPPPA